MLHKGANQACSTRSDACEEGKMFQAETVTGGRGK